MPSCEPEKPEMEKLKNFSAAKESSEWSMKMERIFEEKMGKNIEKIGGIY